MSNVNLARTAVAAALALAIVAPIQATAATRPAGADRGTALGVGDTIRASVGRNGRQANDGSGASKVSADGTVVAFGSAATNLVRGDTNGRVDVFVRDLAEHRTRLVTRARKGVPANGDSRANGISASGRFVAYDSAASNLVAHDTNGKYDVFVRDMSTHEQDRISVSTGGAQADAESFRPAISGRGRYVAFDSYATNLISDDTNGRFDVFVRDRTLDTTARVSVGPGGAQADGDSTGAAVTPNGRYVVFESGATNLVAGDANGQVDVFRHDRESGVTTLVSVGQGGVPSDAFSGLAGISATGRYVVFTSTATNLTADDTNGVADVFVRDLVAGTTVRVSIGISGTQSDDTSLYGSISDDAKVVTFDSYADNLVANDTNSSSDIFLRDLAYGVTKRLSVSSRGQQGNHGSIASSISGNGRRVVFTTAASNLVHDDTNDASDVLLHRFR